MRSIGFWAGLALVGCSGDKTTPTDTTNTNTDTEVDADTDADTDSDTDADTDADTDPTVGLVTGQWLGDCVPGATPTPVQELLQSFGFEMNLTETGGSVTGNGRLTIHYVEDWYTGTTGTTVTTITSTATSPPWTTTTGTGTTSTWWTSGTGYTWTPTGGSGGYTNTIPATTVLPVGLNGTWDGTTIQLGVDVGSGASNPKLEGTIVGATWTGTFTDPTGYFAPFECTFTHQ